MAKKLMKGCEAISEAAVQAQKKQHKQSNIAYISAKMAHEAPPNLRMKNLLQRNNDVCIA